MVIDINVAIRKKKEQQYTAYYGVPVQVVRKPNLHLVEMQATVKQVADITDYVEEMHEQGISTDSIISYDPTIPY